MTKRKRYPSVSNLRYAKIFSVLMSANQSLSLKLRKLLFIALLALICVIVVYWLAQENNPWVVPEEYKNLKNPLPASPSNLHAARDIYFDECVQCHGERGQGDGPQARSHYPLPADLTDPKLLKNVTDGEIFYQISQGRRPMPSFKNRLTPDQRWQLVLLVRSFSQPASSGSTPAAPTPSTPPAEK
jgi:Cytochrome C oxidase, cbb3-type, subunit III